MSRSRPAKLGPAAISASGPKRQQSCWPWSNFGRGQAFALVLCIHLITARLSEGEDRADYRFANYAEEKGRIGVVTHSWMFEKALSPWLSLQGTAVYDAISGATPTGAPPPADLYFPGLTPGPLSTSVPTAPMEDRRWAGTLDAPMNFGRHSLTPKLAYSIENDYESYGAGLQYGLDFNQKNTTVTLGWSHDWDHILPYTGTRIHTIQRKDVDRFLLSLDQLLTAKTVLTLAFTFQNAAGYLDDPYRGVFFQDYPQGDLNDLNLFAESRPRHREGYAGYIALKQYVEPWHGSAEGSYRFYIDSFGIDAHTVELAWNQKIGRRVMLTPTFRYYRQTSASFYAPSFPGDPSNPFNPTPIPTYYSADYRLSAMETFSYGLGLVVKVVDWLSLDLSYHRYDTFGLDAVTSPTAYPRADIVSVGVRFWF